MDDSSIFIFRLRNSTNNSWHCNIEYSNAWRTSSELDEVVVIGYGTAQKRSNWCCRFSYTSDFNKGTVVNAQQLIQGKVAGVSIVSNDGAPGLVLMF